MHVVVRGGPGPDPRPGCGDRPGPATTRQCRLLPPPHTDHTVPPDRQGHCWPPARPDYLDQTRLDVAAVDKT